MFHFIQKLSMFLSALIYTRMKRLAYNFKNTLYIWLASSVIKNYFLVQLSNQLKRIMKNSDFGKDLYLFRIDLLYFINLENNIAISIIYVLIFYYTFSIGMFVKLSLQIYLSVFYVIHLLFRDGHYFSKKITH